MIAIILAAGKGSRLYPLTKNIPKCLVKYKNKTILSYQLNVMKKLRLNKIYIVTGFQSKKLKFEILLKKIIRNIRKPIWFIVYSL